MKKKEWIGNILFHIVLLAAVCMVLYPFVVMVSGAFKSDMEMNRYVLRLIPQEPTLEHFKTLFKTIPFWKQFGNSMLVSCCTVVLVVLVDGFVAYGFSRFEFRGKELLLSLMLSTMLIPAQVLMVPQFQMYTKMKLFGTYIPLMIPSLLGATNIFLLVQIMGQIPRELYESAMIDGSGEIGIFFRIAFPLSKSGFGILAVLTFMSVWNDFMTPLIYLNQEKQYTLSIGLLRLRDFYNISYGAPLAGALLSCIPVILILSVVGQKYFMKGLMVGAVKG